VRSIGRSSTVTLDGNPRHTSEPDVQQVSHTFPSAPRGEHMVRVVAANANGTGANYWTQNVFSTPPVVKKVTLRSRTLPIPFVTAI
jgi:hypothetical protein